MWHHLPVSISYLSGPSLNFTVTLSDITMRVSRVESFFTGFSWSLLPCWWSAHPPSIVWVHPILMMGLNWHCPQISQGHPPQLPPPMAQARHHQLLPPWTLVAQTLTMLAGAGEMSGWQVSWIPHWRMSTSQCCSCPRCNPWELCCICMFTVYSQCSHWWSSDIVTFLSFDRAYEPLQWFLRLNWYCQWQWCLSVMVSPPLVLLWWYITQGSFSTNTSNTAVSNGVNTLAGMAAIGLTLVLWRGSTIHVLSTYCSYIYLVFEGHWYAWKYKSFCCNWASKSASLVTIPHIRWNLKWQNVLS